MANDINFVINGETVLSLLETGGVRYKGRIIETDKELVDGIREWYREAKKDSSTGLDIKSGVGLLKERIAGLEGHLRALQNNNMEMMMLVNKTSMVLVDAFTEKRVPLNTKDPETKSVN